MYAIISKGVCLSVISALFLATFQLLVSELLKTINVFVLISCTYAIVFLVLLLYKILLRKELCPAEGEFVYLVLHMLFHGFTGLLLNTSLLYISPFDMIILNNTNVIMIAFFAFILLKEPLDIIDCLCLVISFVGVYIWCDPSFVSQKAFSYNTNQNIGFMLAIASAFTNVGFALSNRKLVNTKPTLIIMYSSLFTAFLSSLCIPFQDDAATGLVDLLKIAASSVLVFFAHTLLAKAYQIEVATYVTFANSMDIPFVFIFQTVIWKNFPNIHEIIGSSLIFIGFIAYSTKKILYLRFGLKSHKCWFVKEQLTSVEPNYEAIE